MLIDVQPVQESWNTDDTGSWKRVSAFVGKSRPQPGPPRSHLLEAIPGLERSYGVNHFEVAAALTCLGRSYQCFPPPQPPPPSGPGGYLSTDR